MPATATVTGISYKQGSSSIDVVLAIPRRISRSARKKSKNHQVRVTVNYLSVNSTTETVDSGPTPIASTVLLGKIAGTNNVSVQLSVELGAAPPPGAPPGFTSTVELIVQKKPTGEEDVDTEDDDDHGDDHG